MPNASEEARDQVLDLDLQLCFPLYAATRAVTAAYSQALAPVGLTYPQYLVMLVLWESGSRTVSDLGQRLRLDSGTLSPLIKRLEAAGLVTRTRDAADERRVVIQTTGAGRELRSRVTRVPATIAAAMGLDEEAYHALQRHLSTILTNLDATKEI